ncbi:hypothetical protein XCR_2783 [Xanthomonas campestris pv. raphani 756C]|nr:hypothetical protein XCR_2783 [Xanthomonas campestris pv. raphani 756C]
MTCPRSAAIGCTKRLAGRRLQLAAFAAAQRKHSPLNDASVESISAA